MKRSTSDHRRKTQKSESWTIANTCKPINPELHSEKGMVSVVCERRKTDTRGTAVAPCDLCAYTTYYTLHIRPKSDFTKPQTAEFANLQTAKAKS